MNLFQKRQEQNLIKNQMLENFVKKFNHPQDPYHFSKDLLIYFFITQKFGKRKKKSKIERLNLKTIRCDRKKWKDKVVLHYLISQ
eukprot:UN21905